MIAEWYTGQLATIGHNRPAGKLMLGGAVWGEWYLDMLERYCLPSLAADRAGLKDAVIVLYTASGDMDRLARILAGWPYVIRSIPDAAILSGHGQFGTLAACQHLLVQTAARWGMAWHMLMPDQVYSSRYWTNLTRLAQIYPHIAQGGLQVGTPWIADTLESYREKDGSLAIPAIALASSGWRHTAMHDMHEATPEAMPAEHYYLYRARDRVMMFNPFSNPVYIAPTTCSRTVSPTPSPSTFDIHTRGLFGQTYYLPRREDDMAFIALTDAKPAKASSTEPWQVWADRARAGMMEYGYFVIPTEMPAAWDDSFPTAEWVLQRQSTLMALVTAGGRP